MVALGGLGWSLMCLCVATRGRCELSTLLTRSQQNKEMEKMRLVEETLDGLIKLCARQLFDTTDHPDNAAYPFTKGGSQWEELGGGASGRRRGTHQRETVGPVGGWVEPMPDMLSLL